MVDITADFSAPLKDVKQLQFGILGPDELVCYLLPFGCFV